MATEIVTQLSINGLEKRVNELSKQTQELTAAVGTIQSSIAGVNSNLEKLQKDFVDMLMEQRKTAALQEAATELVRVRQEIEQRFGNYKVVRETMLGVLQATDLALVKQTTISRVSEEIMLSTPEYWLAPCLVAIAAWIGNDRELAERAIKEAVKRDKEKTALTMALICRRNNRIDTCYEWLAIYFAQQDGANFSEGSLTYIDAYVNGIFGPDEKHMCDDYIAKWMDEIRGVNSDVEGKQEALWKEYCDKFTVDIDQMFPDLKGSVVEYDKINAYARRVSSVDAIRNNFSGINNAYVDTDRLKASIDKSLIQLISRYDASEEPLRREEAIFLAIRAFDGDKQAAKAAVLRKEQARKEKTLSLVEQMTNILITKEETSVSERKTAVSLLSGYIRKGFDSYMEEHKAGFPENICIEVDGWTGRTVDGYNVEELQADYERQMNANAQAEIASVKDTSGKVMKFTSIGVAVLALVMLFVNTGTGIFALVIAGALFGGSILVGKSAVERRKQISQTTATKIVNGKMKIERVMEQWRNVKQLVDTYNLDDNHEIIA